MEQQRQFTALLTQNVKTKTLVLISPVTYTTESKENFNRELEYLLQKGKVENIIVYQSSLDYLLTGEFWQMKYDRNNPGIKTPGDTTFEVKELGLELLTGKGMPLPHVQMWYTVLKKDFGSNPDNSLTKFFKNIGTDFKNMGTDFKKLIDPMISTPIVEASSDAGSSVSGTYGASQTGKGTSNSIVGTWKYRDSGDPDDYAWIIIFNADGTYNIPEQHPSQLDPDFTNPAVIGRWTRNGDTQTGYFFSPYTGAAMPPWTATVHDNSYSGSGLSGNFNAIRLSAPVSGASIAGVGPLIDEGQNGGGSW